MAEIREITNKDVMEVIHNRSTKIFTDIPVVLLHRDVYEKLLKQKDENDN